jgi:hypothetical protein
LDDFIERCLRERAKLISVVGDECSLIEDLIDEIVVGDASDDSRDVSTSSHPGESLDEMIAVASSGRATVHCWPIPRLAAAFAVV